MKRIILFLILFFVSSPVFAVTYATWDSSNKGSNVHLSNGDLTVDGQGGAWGVVRTAIGKSSGKWYWEMHFDSGSNVSILGVVKSDFSNWNSYLWNDVYGYGMNSKGFGCVGCFGTGGNYNSYGNGFSSGDTLGLALDMDTGSLTYYINGVSQGVAVSGLSGTVYGAIAPNDSPTNVWTSNFGVSVFTYSPPSGYCLGLSDVCVSGSSSEASTTLVSTLSSFNPLTPLLLAIAFAVLSFFAILMIIWVLLLLVGVPIKRLLDRIGGLTR